MICRTTSSYDNNRTTISYDFYRSSNISSSHIHFKLGTGVDHPSGITWHYSKVQR